jgi:hypothetical protein
LQALAQRVRQLDPALLVDANETLLAARGIEQHRELEPAGFDLEVTVQAEPVALALDLHAQGLGADGAADMRSLIEPLDLDAVGRILRGEHDEQRGLRIRDPEAAGRPFLGIRDR